MSDATQNAPATAVPRDSAEGRAYGRKPATHDPFLQEVGPGTPCGELMRRYWLPVGLSEEISSRPMNVRLLGEDLVLFRDKSGRPGLLYPRCMHRGTSLYYGKVDEAGIRCCYHGWKFDVQGNCIDQPCEPGGGLKKEAARQPWYPVIERYGLAFAYLGPAQKQPVLPWIQSLEQTEEGEFHQAIRGSGHLTSRDSRPGLGMPMNWLQAWENVMDPYHVYILHSNFKEIQFHEAFKRMPEVSFQRRSTGVTYSAKRAVHEPGGFDRVSQAIIPCLSAIPPVSLQPGRARGAQWWVPTDDTHVIMYNVQIVKERINPKKIPITPDGKTYDEMTEEEHQDYPGDPEAMSGQGPISLHSDEHLAQSDVGVVLLRRALAEQIRVVQQGGDPVGVAFDEKDRLIETYSGNFFVDV